jgi:6,7-dimethyl-8-ribityllumazine synthase
MRTIEGSLLGEGLRVALVVSRFNGFLTEQLLSGALDTLRRHGVRDDDLTVIRVPGTFEIAAAARRALASASGKGAFDALVALGAVVRGETPHFEYVAGEAVKGLSQIALEGQVAVGFGILTTENLEQAIARAGTKMGNKGADAALAAIEQANLFRELGKKR